MLPVPNLLRYHSFYILILDHLAGTGSPIPLWRSIFTAVFFFAYFRAVMLLQKRIIILCSILSTLLAFYCYNPFALYFQSDDFVHIPLSAQGFLIQRNTFRPICDLSIMLDYSLWGKNAWGYHLTNLLLHVVCCIILFFLVKLILKKYFQQSQTNYTCWLISSLFFVYAMHSEAVLWILGRSAILGSIFTLMALYCYLQKNESGKFIAGFILFFSLSLLTYESSWMLPLYALLISFAEVKCNKSTFKKELLSIFSLLLIFIIYLVIRKSYIHEITGEYESSALLSGDFITIIRNYIILLARSFVPALINNKILLACFIIIAILILLSSLSLKKNKRNISLIIFTCFLVSLLPYTSLGVDTNGTEAERFLYFPTLILCIFTAVVISACTQKSFYFQWLYPVLFTSHIFILYIVTNNYRFAGDVNKMIVSELQKNDSKKTVLVQGLPQSQYGALILRLGFSEMTEWLINSPPQRSIVICSQRSEVNPLHNPYFITYSNSQKILCTAKTILDSTTIKTNTDTVLFNFTDSSLIITK